jgi:hypothetical protein
MNKLPGAPPLKNKSPYEGRIGYWGTVTELHPEEMTVDVLADVGQLVPGVRVASREWVNIDNADSAQGEFLSGERSMPPVGTAVFCLMPTGRYGDSFVLCSGFAMKDSMKGRVSAFKEEGDAGKFIKKRITNGGWTLTGDRRTGTAKAANSPVEGEETVSFEVNQEESGSNKIILKIYENTYEFDESGQGINLKIKGDANIEADGNLAFKSAKDGKLEIGNAVATLGAMVSDLLQALISFKSMGGPTSHTAPELSQAAAQIKAKWDAVFKK